MASSPKLQGGVIISFEKRSHGVVGLLAAKLRDRIELEHYNHPHEIDLKRHQFIIVFNLDDLAHVITTYQAKQVSPPLIIHLDSSEIVREFDYAARFPYVEIAPIEQADLSSPDTTLRIDLFQRIIEFLDRLN